MMVTKTRKKGTSLSRQVVAIVVLLAVCLGLAATLIAVNIISGYRKFPYGDDTYYIVRQKDEAGTISYTMIDSEKNPLETTPDGYFTLKDGTLVALNQSTGLAAEYIRPDIEGNEQIGINDRVLIYPHTQKANVQSIEVHNEKGSFAFYRMRIYEDTDKISYVCALREGAYYLIDENGNNFTRGEDGLYTLASGNKISVNPHTGIITTHTYYDFDGKEYGVREKEDGTYGLFSESGIEITEKVEKTGIFTDANGEEYEAEAYSFLVTDAGTLLNVDPEYGTLSICAVREYNGKDFATYYFVYRGGKFALCGEDGVTIKYTAIDDANYYRTENNAYIAFNEDNGGYNVRVRKDYYIKPDSKGVYSLYNKNKLLTANGSGYYAIDESTYVSFDTASGSYSLMVFKGDVYEETDTKYLNAAVASDAEGEFVIEGFESTTYDPSLFTALVVSGGYTITAKGGKLTTPTMIEGTDKVDFAAYGLTECIRTDATGKEYSYKPSYYILKDLEGNVHRLTFGDPIASNAGFYVKYESLNENGSYEERQAVYILLDNQTQGFTQTYEVFTYYSISDTILASLESIVTPMAVYPMSTNNYFNIEDFIIMEYNSVKSRESLLNDDPEDDDDYYDALIRFHYEDVEERRNTALANFPYIMDKGCLLYGYIINSYSVDYTLMSLMDLNMLGVSHLGVDDRDLARYGLDVPKYMIYFKHANAQNINGDNSQTLLISELTPNDTYYVYSQNYDMIVEVAKNSLNFLNWKSTDWVTTDFYDVNIGFSDKLKIESEDYWAEFDVDMAQTLTANVKSSGSSNFIHYVKTNSDKSEHLLTLAAKINANYSSAATATNLISVKFDTLENYYRYIRNGKSTEGFTSEERNELKAFTDTIYQSAEENGQAMTVHAMTLSDAAGQTQDVYIYFVFDMDGEISASVAVNREAPCYVFSMKAYEAYEKVIFSDQSLTTAEKRLAFDFYLAQNVSATTNVEFEQVVGRNSYGDITVFTNDKVVKTDKDGKVTTHYALGNDYRVFFDVGDGDLLGVSRNWVRYYDMSDPATTESGAYIEIKDATYTINAKKVRLILPLDDGGNKAMKDGSLGDGEFSVTITKDMVVVVDSEGNETRYLRYAGTSPFSSFYSTLLWASYEGYCDIPDEQKEAFKESDDSACQMKLTIDLLNGDNYTYRTYKYSERRAYITANGEGDFFVLRSFVDKIINTSKVIFDGTNIDPTDKY